MQCLVIAWAQSLSLWQPLTGIWLKTQKSKVVEALEKEVPSLDKDHGSVVWVFDAMAVVQDPVQIPDTFGELAEHLFSTIKWQTKDALRIDIVSDTYPEISIKNVECLKRA